MGSWMADAKTFESFPPDCTHVTIERLSDNQWSIYLNDPEGNDMTGYLTGRPLEAFKDWISEDPPVGREIDEICIEVGKERFLIAEDTRHEVKGYRVLRYFERLVLSGRDEEWIWDEQYQFYRTLDAAYKAIKTQDYEAGRRNF